MGSSSMKRRVLLVMCRSVEAKKQELEETMYNLKLGYLRPSGSVGHTSHTGHVVTFPQLTPSQQIILKMLYS